MDNFPSYPRLMEECPRIIESDSMDLGWSNLTYDEAVQLIEDSQLHESFTNELKRRKLSLFQKLCLYLAFGSGYGLR